MAAWSYSSSPKWRITRRRESRAMSMMLQYNVRGILYSAGTNRGVVPPEALDETESVLANCYDEAGHSAECRPR